MISVSYLVILITCRPNLISLKDEAARAGLKINETKTTWMYSVYEHGACRTLMLNEHHLKDVQKLCYLGSLIAKPGGAKADLKQRIAKWLVTILDGAKHIRQIKYSQNKRF